MPAHWWTCFCFCFCSTCANTRNKINVKETWLFILFYFCFTCADVWSRNKWSLKHCLFYFCSTCADSISVFVQRSQHMSVCLSVCVCVCLCVCVCMCAKQVTQDRLVLSTAGETGCHIQRCCHVLALTFMSLKCQRDVNRCRLSHTVDDYCSGRSLSVCLSVCLSITYCLNITCCIKLNDRPDGIIHQIEVWWVWWPHVWCYGLSFSNVCMRPEFMTSMSCDSVYCMCGAAWSSRWLMMQMTNGKHACMLVFVPVPVADIFTR